jgi:UDP-2-acetamido-3-amino-2,3-dideoxy-glucuronate N-acetyltransferase
MLGLQTHRNTQGQAYFAHHTAVIDEGANIGEGTQIWHFAHVRSSASIGRMCVIGKGVYVEGVVGNFCKLQNNVNIYKGVRLEDYVFIGPNATTTNDLWPKADAIDWKITPTLIKTGASVAAGAVIRCGVTLGEGCMIGAGCVVTKNVPPKETWVGIPGRNLWSEE